MVRDHVVGRGGIGVSCRRWQAVEIRDTKQNDVVVAVVVVAAPAGGTGRGARSRRRRRRAAVPRLERKPGGDAPTHQTVAYREG